MGPLEGITVIEMCRWLAGPYAGSMLGDMGATVIKIERPPEGDDTRYTDRTFGTKADTGSYFVGTNRSKRSFTLDLARPEGREIALRLATRCDALIHNFRPGAVEKLGLDYESVRAVRPDIVYCSISSFGETGPLANKPGMDLVVQAMGGIMGLTGDPSFGPIRVGSPIGDYVGAYLTCYAVMLGLFHRQRTGEGQKIEVPLINGQIAMLAGYMPGFAVTGKPSGPVGVGHPQIVPYQTFKTKDNDLIIACLTEEFWARFCDVLEMPELKDDPRFRRNYNRVEHRDELIAIIQPKILGRPAKEWAALLDAADVPSAPVYTMADLMAEPQVKHNEMILEIEHPTVGKCTVTGVPVKLQRTPGRIASPAPLLGEATDSILESLDYTAEQIAAFREQGII